MSLPAIRQLEAHVAEVRERLGHIDMLIRETTERSTADAAIRGADLIGRYGGMVTDLGYSLTDDAQDLVHDIRARAEACEHDEDFSV